MFSQSEICSSHRETGELGGRRWTGPSTTKCTSGLGLFHGFTPLICRVSQFCHLLSVSLCTKQLHKEIVSQFGVEGLDRPADPSVGPH